jgi:predicted phosphodiesterase
LKLHVVSDLHLEHVPGWRLPKADADVLVLAGDVGSGLRGMGAFYKLGKPVLYIPGNHEYYGENIPGQLAAMRLYAKPAGITVLNNDEVVLGGVRFLGTTLWTDFRLLGADKRADALAYAERHFNDYITISNGNGGWLSAQDTADLHAKSVVWLERKLAEPFDGPTVVISHHAPHRNSVKPKYNGHLLTGAFASDLTRLMGKAALWIHGHTHHSFDYDVAGTRIFANPKGYGDENPDFDPGLVVSLPA